MSFSVKNENINLEYNGSSLNGLFSESKHIQTVILRMIRDIIRFNKIGIHPKIKIYQFQLMNFWRRITTRMILLIITSFQWLLPSGPQNRRDFEYAGSLSIEIFDNHGLLQLKDRPQWMVIKGGSKEYLKLSKNI